MQSPIVMVKRKMDLSRMCIDYRKLNQKLVKDKFPLPLIEDKALIDTFARSCAGIFYIRFFYAMVSFPTSMLTKIAESIHPLSSQMDTNSIVLLD
ncbi:hypothetical protein TNCV_4402241 [Trichonephila clavipes]|nr:hypothetical protein TNCV_4402241 [Trichonephila clavipes]